MAYFANLFAQNEYEQKWCARCANYRNGYCPILDLHEGFGNDQFFDAKIRIILDTFIKYSGVNETCTMFVETK